jgi:2-keto-4-pentenoate hydratase/2-oxohepta-3-ene-1,7-dioic acid hydratase in catechol pathway
MKIANYNGRASLIIDERVVDIERASRGHFGPDAQALYERFDELRVAVTSFDLSSSQELDITKLWSPVPAPRQVFAIGLNYHGHAAESGATLPSIPATFTKFPSSLSGPNDPIPCQGPTVDWEIELVVVMGKAARHVPASRAWDFVAGLAVGQDISERTMQFAAGSQYSLGKSCEGFGPIGPWLVTPDEVADKDNLELTCWVNGDRVQNDRTSDMVFSVSALIEELSKVTALWPGDVIFTGTPAGVGVTSHPPRFLAVGDVVRSEIEGIGVMTNTVIPAL